MLDWLFGDKDARYSALHLRLRRLENDVLALEGELYELRSCNMRLLGSKGAEAKKSPDKAVKRMMDDLLTDKINNAGVRGRYKTVAVFEPEDILQETKEGEKEEKKVVNDGSV